MKSSVAFRAALAMLFAWPMLAVAATTSTTTYPDISFSQGSVARPFDLLDPTTESVTIHLTGTWSFTFEPDPTIDPVDVVLAYYPGITLFFAAPHGTDGVYGFDLSRLLTIRTLPAFSEKATFYIPVDVTETFNNPGGLRNFVGEGTASLFVEGFLGGYLSMNRAPVIFDGGMIHDLTITLNPVAAVPEPASYALMVCGLGVVAVASRRRRGAPGQA